MVTAWPLTRGCSKLRRTLKSCWLRDAGICLPVSSTTRDTLSALFSSKTTEVILSSSGTKRTLALAARDCAPGETSASMVYCCTSMRERRSCCAQPAVAPRATVRTKASVCLRDMSDLSFQNFLDRQGGALGRRGSPGQLPAHLGQPFLHLGAGRLIVEQAQRLACQIRAGHLILHQFRHHGASGDQVDHGIKRYVHQELAGQPTGRRHLIEGDHGSAEERGFHGDRSTCGEREIGMRHGVPAFPFNHLNRRAPQAPGKKRGPGGDRGRQQHVDGPFAVDPPYCVDERRQMAHCFSTAASRQHCN